LAGLASGWLVWIFRYVFENRRKLIVAIRAMFLWNVEIDKLLERENGIQLFQWLERFVD